MSPAVTLARGSVCPSCGRPNRPWRQTSQSAESLAPVDTGRLSDTELYRHFKRTAPVEDLRFFLRHARISLELRVEGDALLEAGCRETGGALSRSDWYRRLTALQNRWRRDTADADAALPTVSAEMAEAV
jgi:hypothetical protein